MTRPTTVEAYSNVLPRLLQRLEQYSSRLVHRRAKWALLCRRNVRRFFFFFLFLVQTKMSWPEGTRDDLSGSRLYGSTFVVSSFNP